MSIISIDTLKENGVSAISYNNKNVRFTIKGQKMYVVGLEKLVDIFTKDEHKMFYRMTERRAGKISQANILLVPFKEITEGMKPVARSRFKKKLLENGILLSYRKKLMFNPYILVPGNDKNIPNFGYWVQQVWKYLNDNKDAYLDGIEDFIGEIFK